MSKRELATVTLMPPGGLPRTVTLQSTDHAAIANGDMAKTYYASQHDPVEVDEATGLKLQKLHGWIEWQPRDWGNVEELAPQKPTVKMMAPQGAGATAVIGEDGIERLYPAGVTDVDPGDADALAAKGYRKILNDPARPGAVGLQPGTRWVDSVTGERWAVDSSQSWYKE